MRSLVAAVTLIAATAAAARPQPDDAAVEEGSRKLEAKDYDGALAAFAQAEKLAPKDPRPLYLRGSALAQKRDDAGAEKAYRAALALDGKLAAVHNELALLLEAQKRYPEAAAELKAATVADPHASEAWTNLGRMQMKTGDFQAAERTLRDGAAQNPRDADLRIDLASALRQQKKIEPSLVAAREAVSLAPASADAHMTLALSLQKSGKLDDAATEFTAATRLAPDSTTAWWGLGDVERARKRWQPSLAALDRALKIKPAPAIEVERAEVLRDQGDLAAAERSLRAALSRAPRSLALRLALPKLLAVAKRCEEARRELATLPPAQEDVRAAAREVAERCPVK